MLEINSCPLHNPEFTKEPRLIILVDKIFERTCIATAGRGVHRRGRGGWMVRQDRQCG